MLVLVIYYICSVKKLLMIKNQSEMKKTRLWGIVAIDRYLNAIIARRACLSRKEADLFREEWEVTYSGYYIVIFKL